MVWIITIKVRKVKTPARDKGGSRPGITEATVNRNCKSNIKFLTTELILTM